MAHHWRVDAGWNHDGAVANLSRAVLHWIVGLELTDMNFTNKEYEDALRKQMAWHQHYMANGWAAKPVGKYRIKHPVLAAALIFYVIGFLVGYGVGKI